MSSAITSKIRMTLMLSIALGALGFGLHAMASDCSQVYNMDSRDCPECGSSYTPQFCGYGCISGSCYVAGYGQCCNISYKVWNIWPEDGGDCGECGNIRVRGPAHSAQSAPRRSKGGAEANLATGESLPAAEPSFEVTPYEEVILVPDMCRQTYGIIYPQSRHHQKTSVATPGMIDVPATGGL